MRTRPGPRPPSSALAPEGVKSGRSWPVSYRSLPHIRGSDKTKVSFCLIFKNFKGTLPQSWGGGTGRGPGAPLPPHGCAGQDFPPRPGPPGRIHPHRTRPHHGRRGTDEKDDLPFWTWHFLDVARSSVPHWPAHRERMGHGGLWPSHNTGVPSLRQRWNWTLEDNQLSVL